MSPGPFRNEPQQWIGGPQGEAGRCISGGKSVCTGGREAQSLYVPMPCSDLISGRDPLQHLPDVQLGLLARLASTLWPRHLEMPDHTSSKLLCDSKSSRKITPLGLPKLLSGPLQAPP